jgi:hypothetical protein
MFYFRNSRYAMRATKNSGRRSWLMQILGVAGFCWGNSLHASTKRLVDASPQRSSTHFSKNRGNTGDSVRRAARVAVLHQPLILSIGDRFAFATLPDSFFPFFDLHQNDQNGGRPARPAPIGRNQDGRRDHGVAHRPDPRLASPNHNPSHPGPTIERKKNLR